MEANLSITLLRERMPMHFIYVILDEEINYICETSIGLVFFFKISQFYLLKIIWNRNAICILKYSIHFGIVQHTV